MDEDVAMTMANTLSKKVNGNGTKSIMRPGRKTAEEHNKSRAKMYAVANAATKNDDPYYCGLRARVPNFVNGKHQQQQSKEAKPNKASSNMKKAAHVGVLSPPPQSRNQNQ